MKAKLVNDAITMALWQRRPGKGLISHSDRGSQYCAKSHREILKDHGVTQSMSRKGDCWDNATSESFFSILKGELIELSNFTDQKQDALQFLNILRCFIIKSELILPWGTWLHQSLRRVKSFYKKLSSKLLPYQIIMEEESL